MTSVPTLQISLFGLSANASGDLAIASLTLILLSFILCRYLRHARRNKSS